MWWRGEEVHGCLRRHGNPEPHSFHKSNREGNSKVPTEVIIIPSLCPLFGHLTRPVSTVFLLVPTHYWSDADGSLDTVQPAWLRPGASESLPLFPPGVPGIHLAETVGEGRLTRNNII